MMGIKPSTFYIVDKHFARVGHLSNPWFVCVGTHAHVILQTQTVSQGTDFRSWLSPVIWVPSMELQF